MKTRSDDVAVHAPRARRSALLSLAVLLLSCQSQTPQPTVQRSDSVAASPSDQVASPKSPWGPLAVIPPQDGSDTGIAMGTLLITETCVYLVSAGEKTLLVWPSDRTKWSEDQRAISFSNFDGTLVTASDGNSVAVGGGGDNAAESGLSGKEWARRMTWVAPPDPTCSAEIRWGVGGLTR